MRKLLYLLLSFILLGCEEKGKPLDSRSWGYGDPGTIDEERYDMSIWMIKNNWFQGKTTKDIIEKLPEAHGETIITNNEITYCVKDIDGWNIDSEPRPLAYLDLYFKNDLVVKAVLRERKQTFLDKLESLDGFPIISEQEYKTKLVWEAQK